MQRAICSTMLFVVEFDTTRESSKNNRHGFSNFQARILNFQARPCLGTENEPEALWMVDQTSSTTCHYLTDFCTGTNLYWFGKLYCWCQKTRVVAISCGIKISAMHCTVITIHLRYRRTDVLLMT